jgi:hypothetical protein
LPRRRLTLREFHDLFGHVNTHDLINLAKSTDGIELIDTSPFDCDICSLAKSKKDISRRIPARAINPFDLIHVDIVGPIKPESRDLDQYWTLLTDDATRYR